MFYQTFSINRNLYYPRLLLCEDNAKIQQHLWSTAAILDTETSFLILGPHWFLFWFVPSYYFWIKLKANSLFDKPDHHHLVFWPTVGGRGILKWWQLSKAHFLLCLYIFCLTWARNLTWSFNTLTAHSLVTESLQNFPLGNYQWISVFIEISANCR